LFWLLFKNLGIFFNLLISLVEYSGFKMSFDADILVFLLANCFGYFFKTIGLFFSYFLVTLMKMTQQK